MDDDLVRRINDDVPERLQGIERKRIDEVKCLGGGHLDEAKARMITLLADEFGIKAEALALSQMITALRQLLSRMDQDFIHSILPFADAPAAVDGEHGAGNETGLVAAQEDGGVGTILWAPRALPQRLLAAQEIPDHGVLHRASGHGRVDEPRGDHV